MGKTRGPKRTVFYSRIWKKKPRLLLFLLVKCVVWPQTQRVSPVLYSESPAAVRPHFNIYNCKHRAVVVLAVLFSFSTAVLKHARLVSTQWKPKHVLQPFAVRYKSLPPPPTTGQTHPTAHNTTRCVHRCMNCWAATAAAHSNAAARGLSSIQRFSLGRIGCSLSTDNNRKGKKVAK